MSPRHLLYAILPLCWLSHAQTLPIVSGTFGTPETFATHAELAAYGFQWGVSDGQFGAIQGAGGACTFYGTAGSSAKCAGTLSTAGAYTFTGTLDRVTGSNGCKRLFGPGDGPAGWLFDRDYAGGGQIVPFASGGKRGYPNVSAVVSESASWGASYYRAAHFKIEKRFSGGLSFLANYTVAKNLERYGSGVCTFSTFATVFILDPYNPKTAKTYAALDVPRYSM